MEGALAPQETKGKNTMTTVTLHNSRTEVTGTARTSDPAEAIRRVAARKLGFSQGIGLIQHFPGGGTYHVQFVTASGSFGTSLSDRYVAQVS